MLGTLRKTKSQFAPENMPFSLPQKEAGSSHFHHLFWFVILVLDSFRECIIITQVLRAMEYLPTSMA